MMMMMMMTIIVTRILLSRDVGTLSQIGKTTLDNPRIPLSSWNTCRWWWWWWWQWVHFHKLYESHCPSDDLVAKTTLGNPRIPSSSWNTCTSNVMMMAVIVLSRYTFTICVSCFLRRVWVIFIFYWQLSSWSTCILYKQGGGDENHCNI